MRDLRAWGKLLLLSGAAGIIPALFLEGIRFGADALFSWAGLAARWGFIAGILVAAGSARPFSECGPRQVWPGLFWLGPAIGAGAVYSLTGATWAAWALTSLTWVLLLGMEEVLTAVP